MSCNDIPSLLDLQKAKLNADDLGRLMGTGTGTSTNEVTGQVRPTYNKVINEMQGEFNQQISDQESEFNQHISGMGYTRVGTFATGATLTNPRQTLLWDIADGGDGQEYGWSGTFPKVVPANSTPASTGGIAVGAWISRYDPALRSDLAGSVLAGKGAAIVGSAVATVELKSELANLPASYAKNGAMIIVKDDGTYTYEGTAFRRNGNVARLDGTINFTNVETDFSNQTVAFRGPVVVTSPPSKNKYEGGNFTVNGFSFDAASLLHPMSFKPSFHKFGGQLNKLKKAMSDPLVQFIGISFLGDSNTWGVGTNESASQNPRNHTLDDPRDYSGTYTWVNNIKRYIGGAYFNNAAPVVSNWHSSPSGEAISEYSKEMIIFPRGSRFDTVVTGSASENYRVRDGSISGWQFYPKVATTGSVSTKFQFTGKSLTIVYTGSAGAANYDLIVDGVLLGTYDTYSAETTVNLRHDHSFQFIKDKTIEIRVKHSGRLPGVEVCYFEAIVIKKTMRITNQGIIGTTSKDYTQYNLINRKAISADEDFVFVQFGGNDRAAKYDSYPGGTESFRENMEWLISNIPLTCSNIILSSSADGVNDSIHTFTRAEARDTIRVLAEDLSLDFIDNWALFYGMHYTNYTVDGTHMNKFANGIVAKNVISAIEL